MPELGFNLWDDHLTVVVGLPPEAGDGRIGYWSLFVDPEVRSMIRIPQYGWVCPSRHVPILPRLEFEDAR